MSQKKDKKNNKKKEIQGRKLKLRMPHAKWIRWGIVTLLSLVFAVLSLFWIPGNLHYIVTETYAFTSDEAAQVKLAVLLPTSGHYQDISEPDITWQGVWDIRSDGRLDVALFEVDLEAEGTVHAVIQYQVALSQGEARWVGDPVTADDLAPAEEIQSDHAEIIAQAESLTNDGDEQETVRQIFTFTYHHLDFSQETGTDTDLSALSAFQSGVGDCAEHANLMTALCRAAQIPAHVISGVIMPDIIPFIPVTAAWDHPAGAHAWVEFFADDAWQMADSGWSGQFFKHTLFGWTDGRHLVYDTALHEAQVYQSLLAEAENDSNWLAAMSAPLRFVAWSDGQAESIQFTPEVTLRKTWDARYLMILSVVVILVVMSWLIGENRRQSRHMH